MADIFLPLHAVDNYRFRIAAWCCGLRACRFDDQVPVVIIFTQPKVPAENVVRELLFSYFYEDDEYDRPRRDEENVCWTFLRLYWLLTDWQNIIREVERELEEAVCVCSRRFSISMNSCHYRSSTVVEGNFLLNCEHALCTSKSIESTNSKSICASIPGLSKSCSSCRKRCANHLTMSSILYGTKWTTLLRTWTNMTIIWIRSRNASLTSSNWSAILVGDSQM